MTNSEKLQKLLDSINEIETYDDGSIRIVWKANVAHEVPGHLINYAHRLNVVSGKQVHFNPELSQAVNQVQFTELQHEVDKALAETTASINKTHEKCVNCE